LNKGQTEVVANLIKITFIERISIKEERQRGRKKMAGMVAK
jgi:hypothetical protein